MAQPLRVGFDLDGVILYNPARVIRPIVAAVKQRLLGEPQSKVSFYVPHRAWEQKIWIVLHKSSLFLAPGFEKIEQMVARKQIDAYIITARYDFLSHDFEDWIIKMRADTYTKAYHHNEKNQQPHLYKEAMIRRYDIDVFVEDNLDIVEHLQKTFPDKTIIWIYNILDKNHPYTPKFPSLKDAIGYISSRVER